MSTEKAVTSILILYTLFITPILSERSHTFHQSHQKQHQFHDNAKQQPINNNNNNEQDPSSTYITIYSSCSDITEDGMYYIKPLPDSDTILPVICSNGYVMLDGSLDENLLSYPSLLSSNDYGRFNKYYLISDLDDLSTYREWLLFANENTKFNVAPGCMSCQNGQFDDNTVYYIDSHTYCFSGAITTGCIDDTKAYDYHPESCNQCDVGVFPNDDLTQPWTKCMALQLGMFLFY